MGHLEVLRNLYAERRLDEAWTAYQGSLASRDPEWHLYGALTAWAAGRRTEGADCCDRCRRLRPKGPVRTKLHFITGLLRRELGDSLVAAAEFDACLRNLPRTPDLHPVLYGPCLYNKALALYQTGDIAGALALSDQALQEFDREHLDDYRRQALQNIAWYSLDLGDTDRATEALDESRPLCVTEDALWRQTMLVAYLQRAQGRRTEALRACERIMACETVAPDVQSLAASLAAEAALELALMEAAVSLSAMALDLASKVRLDRRCWIIALRAIRKVQFAQRETGA